MRYKQSLIISFLVFLVMGSISVFLLFFEVPKIAERTYGPADTHLDFSQKVLYSFQLLVVQEQLMSTNYQPESSKKFEILPEETAEIVSKRLFLDGMISNPEALLIYLKYSGLDKRIRSGQFEISPAMSALEIVATICDMTPDSVKFSILPGMRAEEIAELLPTSGLRFTKESFLFFIENPNEIQLPDRIKDFSNLEGLLFPGEYFFNRDTQVEEFLLILINRFLDNLSQELINSFQKNGLTLQQGITLASIIQREGIVMEERATIASVFLNRIKSGMLLQSDATVQYALGRNGANWWKAPLTLEDLAFDSPFNTYQNFGLPLHPICNPDMTSITSAAYPVETNYLFFQANCDNSGRHVFVQTMEEQLENLCE